MVKGLWHFSFTVSDLDRSLEFYCGLLGMQLRLEQRQANPYTRRLVGYPDATLRVAQLTIQEVSVGPSGHLLELSNTFASNRHRLSEFRPHGIHRGRLAGRV